MSPRVTVAIRTKNRPLLLARALDSVRGQTMTDLELVVVNDAGELAPVERLMKERLEGAPFTVRLIDNPVSAGREAAMNLGFRGSTADYLVLLDDDDTWAPDFLEACVAHLDAHPEEGGVATRAAVIRERIVGDEIVEVDREAFATDRHEVSLAHMLRANYVTTNSFMFRREVFDAVGPYDGSLPVLADWKFNLQVLRRHRIGFLDGEPRAFWHHRLEASGDVGNSVVVDAHRHAGLVYRIRDDEVRRSIAEGDGFGMLALLVGELAALEERLAGAVGGSAEMASAVQLDQAKALDAVRVQLETAIGRLEGRQIETQIALARIEQIVRAGGPLQRELADRGRELSARVRPLASSAASTAKATATGAAKGAAGLLAGGARALAGLAKRRRGAQAAVDAAPLAATRPQATAPAAMIPAAVSQPAPAGVPDAGTPVAEHGAAIEPAAVTAAIPVVDGSIARDVVRAAAPETVRTPRGDARFPDGGRRAIIYMFFDPQGQVDDYVLVKLEALREHAERIFVVSNGPITEEGRARLESVADDVWERENVGFDVWAYKEAQERIGWEELAGFDELILMNYTFFGPIYPFSEVFDRVGPQDVDFWGLTEHGEVHEHEVGPDNAMPPHIQSHWIAVRGPMLRSPEYRAYWDEMPMITSYHDSIQRHEARFTKHFADRGFSHLVAFPESDYPSRHPIFDDIVLMLDDRLPIVKRRLFFHDPLYLERNVIIGRDVLARLEAAGYPLELVWTNLVRSSKPRSLATNMNLLEVLPHEELPAESGRRLDRDRMPSIAVLMHLHYDDLLDEMLDRVDLIPGRPRLVITTSDEERAGRIRAGLERRGWEDADVRVVASNRGRDISAFYLGCEDVLRDESIDLVVKIHGKKSVQDGYNAGQWFKRHLLDNLLPSEGYAANLIAQFQRDRTLGIVMPPVVNMGYPTLGHAWFSNRQPAMELAKRLGVTVPLDDSTPLAPLGSMFVARRDALMGIVEAGFQWSDFPEEGGYKDGTLAHVLERFVTYAAAQRGYRVGEVMSPEMAGINYGFLEYRLQSLTAILPGATTEEAIAHVLAPGLGSVALTGMQWLSRRVPRASWLVWPTYHFAVRTGKAARSAVRAMKG